jgi:hypothetical protein
VRVPGPPATPPAGPWWLYAGMALARRPDLWWVALIEARSLLVIRWWRKWPPVPRPAKAWLEFRMETAYGDRRARPSAEDVVTWLAWCRDTRRSSGGTNRLR